MIIIRKLSFFFLAALLFLSNARSYAQVHDGILNLRQEVIDESWAITLNGNWEFYWKRYLYPEDFKTPPLPEYDLTGAVPGYWTDYKLNNKHLAGQGHGTYRLTIRLPEQYPKILSFKIPVFDASYRLYLNGSLMAGNGKPGISEGTSQVGYLPEIVRFVPPDRTEQEQSG